jgi:hypothetical protein
MVALISNRRNSTLWLIKETTAMKIEIKKSTPYQSEYTITRDGKSFELITLETKTFLVHDISHYAVEKHLQYSKGFWGLLSKGHSFNELFGKDNPQTTELRLIEKIVGPVQSTYLGYIPKEDFEQFVKHLDFTMPESVLNSCLTEIESILKKWEHLLIGQQLTLEWKL